MTRRLPIVVTYSVRHEPQWLVDELQRNVGWVDDFVEVDNRRDRTPGWQHEGKMRVRQRRMIADQFPRGAWVIQLDPDERLEDRAAEIVPDMIRRAEIDHADRLPQVSLSFPLREMWTPLEYRCDGDWATKKPRARGFPLLAGVGQSYGDKPIHQGIMPRRRPGDVRLDTDIWLFHLKNIEPMNRVKRAAAYLAADPDFEHQRREGRDWTWIYDETGLTLAPIPDDRYFTPKYSRPYDFTIPGDDRPS